MVAAIPINNRAQTGELERLFEAQYGRVARLIARVLRNPGRAEELAVEVFLKYSRQSLANGTSPEGWLVVTAARVALDELRSQARRSRYEPLLRWIGKPQTPEELHQTSEEQRRVRTVLGKLPVRQAELLLLRMEGLSYAELASVLGIHAASVGTFLSRAQKGFRKEYVERYGTETYG